MKNNTFTFVVCRSLYIAQCLIAHLNYTPFRQKKTKKRAVSNYSNLFLGPFLSLI